MFAVFGSYKYTIGVIVERLKNILVFGSEFLLSRTYLSANSYTLLNTLSDGN